MNYCCCAIPLVNAGIYAVLIEQFILAILVGALSVATPAIVGAVVFNAAPIILAIVCFVAAAIQLLGLFGVAKERPILFRRYVTLHSLITCGAFGVAIAWTVISATRHSTALSRCKDKFFPTDGQGQISGAGETLCDIFPWVSVGLMGGLTVLLGILHLYFFFVLSAYGRQQRDDHFKYNSVYNPLSAPAADNIAMDTTDYGAKERGLGHNPQNSAASMSDVLSQPAQQPRDSLGYSYGQYGAGTPYSESSSYQAAKRDPPSRSTTLVHPATAYTEEPNPTPTYYNPHDNYDYDGTGLNRPAHSQSHPGKTSYF